ncbi:hypothetical protein ACWFR5_41380 [Streptomyces sp. NPDC055092]
MELSEISTQAVTLATDLVGGVAQDAATKSLSNLIVSRLAPNPASSQVFTLLQQQPLNEQLQRDAAHALRETAEADAQFADTLGAAVAAALAEREKAGSPNSRITGTASVGGRVGNKSMVIGAAETVDNSRRNIRLGIGGIALLAFVGGGVGLYQTVENRSADQESTQQSVREDEGKTGGNGMPEASTLGEAASQVRNALGSCDQLRKGSAGADKYERAQGITLSAVCFTANRDLVGITMLDVGRHEAHLKNENRTATGGRYYGQGFYLELESPSPGSQQIVDFKNALLAAGYLYVDCSKEFSPYGGVKVIKAQTPGCRYTDVF